MKDQYRNGKLLNRAEWLNAVKKPLPAAEKDRLSTFSQRSTEGWQKYAGAADAENILRKFDRNLDHHLTGTAPPVRKFRVLPTILRLVAAILLLMTAAYFAFLPADSSQLYTDHFKALPNAVAETSSGERGSDLLSEDRSQALYFYENDDFTKALPFFESHLKKNPEDQTFRLYYGIALLGAMNGTAAIEELGKVVADPPTAGFKENAQWYLALAYLQTGRPEQAKPLLATLGNSVFYGEKARALLQQL